MKYYLILVSFLTISGCCFEVDCLQENLNLGLVSFSPSDMDTIIFRKYDANSNFQSPRDTMQITNISVLTPRFMGDTIIFMTSNYQSSNIKFQLVAGNDYEIYFPGISKVTRITEIHEQKTKQRRCFVSDGNHGCFNQILSYKVDGEETKGEYFFIHK